MLRLQYNGARFPRVIILKNHKKTTFLSNRRVLTLDDYNAYLLLRNNVRISAAVWEINVVEVIEEKPEIKVSPQPQPEEKPKEASSEKVVSEEKPKRSRPKYNRAISR